MTKNCLSCGMPYRHPTPQAINAIATSDAEARWLDLPYCNQCMAMLHRHPAPAPEPGTLTRSLTAA